MNITTILIMSAASYWLTDAVRMIPNLPDKKPWSCDWCLGSWVALAVVIFGAIAFEWVYLLAWPAVAGCGVWLKRMAG
jgi:hypothetical protein